MYSKKLKRPFQMVLEQFLDGIKFNSVECGDKTKYTHISLRTRSYRDDGSATYQLIRSIESILGKYCVKDIFFRYVPEVDYRIDFNRDYGLYRGLARFTILH